MATDKQVAANRANARKSTGPRTEAGRRRAAQNALRHGLSIPLERDPAVRERTLHLADSILREHGNAASEQALELAAAQLDLERIGHVRSHAMLRLKLDVPSPEQIWRLASIDRYEHQARRRRRRAMDYLQIVDDPGLPDVPDSRQNEANFSLKL